LKEEGDSSHVNQTYNKFVAKSNKTCRKSGWVSYKIISGSGRFTRQIWFILVFIFSEAPNLRLGPPHLKLATWILKQGYHFQNGPRKSWRSCA
jgi:hypothetical protein